MYNSKGIHLSQGCHISSFKYKLSCRKMFLYWSNITSDIDGMMGGFSNLHHVDILFSKRFIQSLRKIKKFEFKKFLYHHERAIDCGCGVGRITKNLLLPIFNTVDMVDITEEFIEKSAKYIGRENKRVGKKYISGLQDFVFLNNYYDIIWIQWVTGYLTDQDLVKFMQQCKNGIKKGGCIVIKDNVSTNDKVFYDDEDASWTRPKDQIVDLCKQSGLKMIHDKKQQNFPDDMLPVYMIAFR
ncbi:unnamed protein product [Dracunculus medinensis]|uniref:Alpha N-terminal protein methyltransferase 1 n=1 Tax=Dracunculus medinensis TaxID=318479 RepID=A0A3P7SCT3_DRAME|nr:unnamed protein product [Dracunculus medinensis]